MKSNTAMQAGLLALVIVAASASAQQHKTFPPANGGVVSGRVFAITNGGDLKPARLAEIHLFYAHRPTSCGCRKTRRRWSHGRLRLTKTLFESSWRRTASCCNITYWEAERRCSGLMCLACVKRFNKCRNAE
jgi:hypothetical protein